MQLVFGKLVLKKGIKREKDILYVLLQAFYWLLTPVSDTSTERLMRHDCEDAHIRYKNEQVGTGKVKFGTMNSSK